MSGPLVINGRVPALNAQLSWLNQLQFGLFTNNFTIVEGTNMSDLVEAAWSGYARATPGSFATPGLNSSLQAQSTASPVQFLNSSGSTVTFYGWFLYDPTSHFLISAENYGLGPISIPASGFINLVPIFTDTTAI